MRFWKLKVLFIIFWKSLEIDRECLLRALKISRNRPLKPKKWRAFGAIPKNVSFYTSKCVLHLGKSTFVPSKLPENFACGGLYTSENQFLYPFKISFFVYDGLYTSENQLLYHLKNIFFVCGGLYTSGNWLLKTQKSICGESYTSENLPLYP